MDVLTPQELLQARAKDGSRRQARNDPFHLALVLEGGGMRGVVCIGMAAGFEDLGLTCCFDSVHGSSAGACNGAYFCSGQARYGGAIYYEDVNNRQFIDYLRPLRGRPIMDTYFLIDNVMQTRKILDTEPILDAPGLLNIVLTHAVTGEERVVNAFRDRKHVFETLKGTVCLPLIAGWHARVDGEAVLDGGMTQHIPLRSAEALGATHAIVLMARRLGEIERPEKPDPLYSEASMLSLFYNRNIRDLFGERHARINEVVQAARSGRSRSGTQVDAIARLNTAININRLTIDGAALKQGFADGMEVAKDYVNGRRYAV